MKLFILLLFSIFSSLFIQAQNMFFGFTGIAGISGVSMNKHKIVPKSTFNVGLFAEKVLTDNSLLRLELVWMQLNSVEVKGKPPMISFSDQLGAYTRSTRINYWALPVWIRVPVKKVALKSGLKMMVFMRGKSILFYDGPIYTKHFIVGDKTHTHDVRRVHFGIQTGADYTFNKTVKWRLDLAWSLHNMMAGDFHRKHFQVATGFDITF